VTENWPPYNYQTDNGEVGGVATEVVKRVLNNAKLSYNIDVFPWARSYKLAQGQPNTLIYSIFKTAEREPYFHWFCPLLPNLDMFFFALSGKQIEPISSIDASTSLKIGVVREDFPYQVLKSRGLHEGKHLYLSSSDQVNLKRLLAGEVDVVPTSIRSMKTRLEKMGLTFDKVVPVYQLLSSESTPICMAMSVDSNPDLVNKISIAFEKEISQPLHK
jgi:polar amino acid transport system substrate-binding protein